MVTEELSFWSLSFQYINRRRTVILMYQITPSNYDPIIHFLLNTHLHRVLTKPASHHMELWRLQAAPLPKNLAFLFTFFLPMFPLHPSYDAVSESDPVSSLSEPLSLFPTLLDLFFIFLLCIANIFVLATLASGLEENLSSPQWSAYHRILQRLIPCIFRVNTCLIFPCHGLCQYLWLLLHSFRGKFILTLFMVMHGPLHQLLPILIFPIMSISSCHSMTIGAITYSIPQQQYITRSIHTPSSRWSSTS